MNIEQLRLECLKLACQLDAPREEVVELAGRFLAFVMSGSQTATA